ncbi:MAG: hypothetical protein KGK07_16345 [Chloroflexota bacterium]|nr:hypothetical protein [Chloroflexota bacterium]
MRRFVCYQVAQRRVGEWFLLEPAAGELGGPTITNAAEEVVADLHHALGLRASERVFYVDTDGRVDELLHDGVGKFTGFAFGHEGVDLDSP